MKHVFCPNCGNKVKAYQQEDYRKNHKGEFILICTCENKQCSLCYYTMSIDKFSNPSELSQYKAILLYDVNNGKKL